mmetsp:Transcript_25573/g.38888  ORF Transcript_25573/g.38888 Transcript_25573/m.38888 type:complete len:85 (-) Transcript_25573:374-628(-)
MLCGKTFATPAGTCKGSSRWHAQHHKFFLGRGLSTSAGASTGATPFRRRQQQQKQHAQHKVKATARMSRLPVTRLLLKSAVAKN